MLSIVALALALLWVLGVSTDYLLGGFIHVFLILAVMLPIIQVIKSRGQRAGQADHAARIHLQKKTAP
jgi:hypothetical protein